MTEAEWKEFLRDYNRELLAYEEVLEQLSKEEIRSGWLGFPGASDSDIVETETRLRTRLPASYRAFLRVSNGWRFPSCSIYKLLPTTEVAWFLDRNQDWIDAYVEPSKGISVGDEEYFVYGPKQNCCAFRFFFALARVFDLEDEAVELYRNPGRGFSMTWDSPSMSAESISTEAILRLLGR
jgi:hypothetical protein